MAKDMRLELGRFIRAHALGRLLRQAEAALHKFLAGQEKKKIESSRLNEIETLHGDVSAVVVELSASKPKVNLGKLCERLTQGLTTITKLATEVPELGTCHELKLAMEAMGYVAAAAYCKDFYVRAAQTPATGDTAVGLPLVGEKPPTKSDGDALDSVIAEELGLADP